MNSACRKAGKEPGGRGALARWPPSGCGDPPGAPAVSGKPAAILPLFARFEPASPNGQAANGFPAATARDEDFLALELDLAELLQGLETCVNGSQPDRIHDFSPGVLQLQVASAVPLEQARFPHEADGLLGGGVGGPGELLDRKPLDKEQDAKAQGNNENAPQCQSQELHHAVPFLPIFWTHEKCEIDGPTRGVEGGGGNQAREDPGEGFIDGFCGKVPEFFPFRSKVSGRKGKR